MAKGLIGRIFKDSNEREIARHQKVVEQINALEPEYRKLSDEDLFAKTDDFRRRLVVGETLDDILVEAFAAIREATWRTIGLRHYDVQLIGGMILHEGKITEMKTGEGKTLVATLPLYLNGLELNPDWIDMAEEKWGDDVDQWEFKPLDRIPVGLGVHLVTVNDYLARRDGGWMGPAFHSLGLSVGLVIPGLAAVYDPGYVQEGATLEDARLVHWRPTVRKESYQADITYGTNNEFGFDYLRDNMVRDLTQCVQRDLNLAIIDEVDNVLVDEARTPLIISGPSDEPSDLYRRFSDIARRLKAERDYEVDERTRVVTLTDDGISRVESVLTEINAGESLYDQKHSHVLPYLDNALHAHVIYKRDKDYIVKDGQVIIVDEFTGRMLHGRRYSEGLHQAIEAKEGLAVQRESLTYGTITIQNYYRMYDRLAGMTGTAATEKEEFRTIYDLDVIVLPTNVEYRSVYGNLTQYERQTDEVEEVTFAGVLDGRDGVTVATYELGDPLEERFFRRLDLPDAIYLDVGAKFEAIVQEIEDLHQAERPVLVGTIAVETSEHISRLLDKRGIPHNVLNAKKHDREALIVAQAGRPGAVTIATNMAGRGVDILLGGNPEALAAGALRKRLEARLPAVLADAVTGSQETAQSAKISEETLRTARALADEYAAYEAAKAEGGSALPIFLAERLVNENLLAEQHRAEGVKLARSVLAGAWNEAGQLAQQTEGLDMETLSNIERIRERFESAGDEEQYVTSNLSATYHNLLMTIIRLTLRQESETAQDLISGYPELPPDILQTVELIHKDCQQDAQKVYGRGGLHVIGTERHEARRIDNQLRGRAGRQGDPGSSHFFLSMEDELMRRFGGERVQNLMRQMGMGDVPLEMNILSKTVESAQSRVEGYNFDLRKHVLEYDDVINKQREVIYDQRRQVLSEDDLRDQILRMVEQEIGDLVATHCITDEPDEWDLRGLHSELRTFVPLPADGIYTEWRQISPEEIQAQVQDYAEKAYDAINKTLAAQFYQEAVQRDETLSRFKTATDPLWKLLFARFIDRAGQEPDEEILELPLRSIPEDLQPELEKAFEEAVGAYRDRQTMLRAVDSLWVRYLTDLAILREGIGLRAFGQQNPLVAFRKEGHEMYQVLLGQIQSQIARQILRAPVALAAPRHRQQLRARRPSTPGQRRQAQSGAAPDGKKPGRNEPCWCGSGKKYKHCHMQEDLNERKDSVTHVRPPKTPGRRGRRRR
jgi:preprotein translocase subunit SecA